MSKAYQRKGQFFFAASLVSWPFPTAWGLLDRRKVQDYPELHLPEREMVEKMAATTVPPLKDLLREELLVALCHRDLSTIGKHFS